MDLIDFRQAHGRAAWLELAKRAGLARTYLYQITGGFKGISIDRAREIAALHADLDVVALLDMKKRALRIRKRAKANGSTKQRKARALV